MSWGRIDDTAPEHAKWARLEAKHGARAWADASAVWFCVLCYANRNHTDGRIATVVLARLTPLGKSAIKAAETMVDVGLMDRTEEGYELHDFLEYNDSAEDVSAKRKAEAERQRARRRAKDGTYVRPDDGGRVRSDVRSDVRPYVHPESESSTDGVTSTPSRPVPSRTPTESKKGASSASPDPSERIASLLERYPHGLPAAVRAACGAHRKTGRMTDGAWLSALERFAVFDSQVAIRAMERFVDRYGDGSKDESYLVGIMRGERDQPAQGRLPSMAPVVGAADPVDWHPVTHGQPRDSRNDATWNAWVSDGCPPDPTWARRGVA